MLFTDTLFSLQSPSSARDKKSTAEDLFMTASGRGELVGEEENTVMICGHLREQLNGKQRIMQRRGAPSINYSTVAFIFDF